MRVDVTMLLLWRHVAVLLAKSQAIEFAITLEISLSSQTVQLQESNWPRTMHGDVDDQDMRLDMDVVNACTSHSGPSKMKLNVIVSLSMSVVQITPGAHTWIVPTTSMKHSAAVLYQLTTG